MQLILIRHAESCANAAGVVEGGGGDSPLSARGIEQARRAAGFIKREISDVRAVYASPQRRAAQTAAPIATALAADVRFDEDLIEGRLGAWEGRTFDRVDWSLLERDPDFRTHGGESPRQLAARSVAAMRTIRAAFDTGSVVVVSHGATISHGLAALFDTLPVVGSQYGCANTGALFVAWAQAPALIRRDVAACPSDGLD